MAPAARAFLGSKIAPPMRVPATLLMAVAVLAAGCTQASDGPASASPTPTAADAMNIAGTVQGPGLLPVADATVEVVGLGLSDTTDAEGGFSFAGLPRAIHLLTVTADGFESGSVQVDPATAEGPVLIVLAQAASTLPFNATQAYRGILQCAMEVLIISGSCDTLVTFAGQEPVLAQNATWDLSVQPGWRTLVLDVDFDPGAQPGLDGLRVVVRAQNGTAALNEYAQYARFNGSAPFTARIEPGATYPDGIGPVPANATVFRLDVYPHSRGWHAVCDPTGLDGSCFLGAGAGVDVAFDLYVTAFYNEPAPDGWTLLR